MSTAEEKKEQLGVGYEEEGGEENGEEYEEEEEFEDEDAKLEEMKRRVEEMEQEAAKLSKMQQQVKREMSSAADSIDEHSMCGPPAFCCVSCCVVSIKAIGVLLD